MNYLYGGANLLEELDSGGNLLGKYTQGPGIDQPLSELRGGTTSYNDQDGLGSVSSLSNSAGTLANTYSYDSFGKLTGSTGTVTDPFQYTGREFDSETGMYYYRARYYDQTVGRFLSEDPIGLMGGPNFYQYVNNDPVSLIDPPGLSPRPVPPYRWRNCNQMEEAQCRNTCSSEGKEFESCRVSQRYRIISWKNGPDWVDGPLSCSCKDPNECPKLKFSPNPNTINGLALGAAGGGLLYVFSEYWWVPALLF
jgi:RHS repeat-associated protein